MADEVLLDVVDGLATVTLNRPDKLNIFNLAMRDALIEAVTAVRDVPGIGAMVLRAEGPHFSAGADLAEFGTAEHALEARRIRWDRDPWGVLWDLPCPTIAALHGVAMGSGLEMSLLCDVRLAAPETRLGLPETRLGMLPAAGGTQSMTRAIGPHAALPLIASSRTFGAAEAVSLGLVHRVAEEVDAEAAAVGARWVAMGITVTGAARRALHAAGDLPLEAGLQLEKRLARAVLHQSGRVEGPEPGGSGGASSAW